MRRIAPTTTRLAAAALLALSAGCSTVRTTPLAVEQEPGETAATRVYRVEELEFEAPAGWVAEATTTAFALRGGDPACALPEGWGDPTALAMDGRVARAGCPLLVLAPSAGLTIAECPQDETWGRRNRWLASAPDLARRPDTVDGRQARRQDWKATAPPAGRAVIWCVCGPSRPWYLTFWIPAGAEAEGAAALRLFQRTIRVGEGRDWN